MNKNSLYITIFDISKKTGVPVKKIQDMLFALHNLKSVNNNQLIRTTGVSRNALNQIKLYLSKYLKSSSSITELNENSEDIKSMFLDQEYAPEEKLFSLLEDEKYRKNLKFLNTIQKLKPLPLRDFDQFTATIETTAKRASLLNFFADIREKRILFLGDDDFSSIATANYNMVKEITVLDIDERILESIRKISIQEKLEIEVIKYDVRKKLPKTLSGKYDIVFTDPPYTLEGIKLFTSRAIEALNHKNQSARLYICFGNSDRAKERFIPIYDTLIKSGLMIRWIFDKFNRYSGAESIGSSSSLIICDVTPKTKPLIDRDYDRPIYTNN